MRVLIGPIGAKSGTYSVAPGSENPGIGGTDHVSLQLAVRLAASTDVNVDVAVESESVFLLGPNGPLETVNVSRQALSGEYDACLTPVWRVRDVVSLAPPLSIRRLIAWSHHPHDRELARLCAAGIPDAVVSVGGYQYYSNRPGDVEHHWIPNPYPYWADRPASAKMDERELLVGHMGAIVKAKGFHRIALHWNAAVRELPGVRLEVVGSGGLYGALPSVDTEIPAEPWYAEKIRAAFGPGGVPTSVTFLGLLPSKLGAMSRWKYGLQNLTGGSEAMPAGVQELIVHGVPVIGSRNFGMWDFIQDFPELTVGRPSEYPKVLGRIEKSSLLTEELLGRCSTVASRWRTFDSESLMDAWLEIFRGTPTLLRTPKSPPLPKFGNSLKWRAAQRQLVESARGTAHDIVDPLMARRQARLRESGRG